MSGETTTSTNAAPARRGRGAVVYQLLVVLPLLAWLGSELSVRTHEIVKGELFIWAIAITTVDLLPLPLASDRHFSLSFPLELAVALVYSPWVAASVGLIGASDHARLATALANILRVVPAEGRWSKTQSADGLRAIYALKQKHGAPAVSQAFRQATQRTRRATELAACPTDPAANRQIRQLKSLWPCTRSYRRAARSDEARSCSSSCTRNYPPSE